jgi:hypothetical protein
MPIVHRCQVLRVSRPAYSDTLAASGTGADHLRDQRSSAGGLACQWRELWVAGAYQAIVQRQPVPGLGVYSDRSGSPKTQTPRR